tara:strand:- start:166 stop:399 length:234 start_codon:yes stop_codon:yes gene_type:complete
MAICVNCEEEYSNRRQELGYSTCLSCGEADALLISQKRAQATLRELTPYASASLGTEGQPETLSSLSSLFERDPREQ